MPNLRQSATSVVFLPALLVMAAASARADEAQNAANEKEAELVAVLRSDAPGGEKAIACKNLAIYGSSEAVPELARLLPDEQLASWARIALEAIPGSAADEALLKATDSLTGKLLVGTINSIGVRRDVKAVDRLTARLEDRDDEVASAAAVALGNIGNAAAAKSLRKVLPVAPAKVRSAVAEGCVLCAERFLSEGNAAEAAEIYDEVRKADVPKQRILEATRGAILSRKQDGIGLLVENLKSADKALFQMALGTAREFPGGEIDKALATEMVAAAPERAALVIEAMADRKETVVLSAVLKAAGKGPKPVRLAAIGALGRVGDASCLSPLVEIALEEDDELAQSAKAALGDLPGENVDKDIVARLSKAKGKTYPLLLEVVGQRRIDAIDALLKAVDHSDKAVRSAALTALGATVDLKRLSVLIAQVVKPKHDEDAEVAQQALKTACVRMPEREECAQELAAAVERSPSAPTKTILLETLGVVGGARALEAMVAAAKSSDPKLLDASTRLLGEWTTADAAPVLLDLTKSVKGEKFQVRAMNGYIRIANKFVMPEPDRTEMCKIALAAAKQPAEQKKVLDVLKKYPNLENLKLAVKAAEVPELKEDATAVVMFIAQKLAGKAPEVQELLSKVGLEKVKLEIVKAEYGAGETQKDVTELLQKQAGDSLLIALPAEGYNASFGGDPVPNTAKQLKIQYKINGKAGEATFAENALILLPMPK
jgi:HEAT repeat protein